MARALHVERDEGESGLTDGGAHPAASSRSTYNVVATPEGALRCRPQETIHLWRASSAARSVLSPGLAAIASSGEAFVHLP